MPFLHYRGRAFRLLYPVRRRILLLAKLQRYGLLDKRRIQMGNIPIFSRGLPKTKLPFPRKDEKLYNTARPNLEFLSYYAKS